MAEVTNELMYEVLKAVHQDIRALKDGQNEIRNEIVSVGVSVVSVHHGLSSLYGMLGRYEQRLDRIARRTESAWPRSLTN
jgi:hypothetical protein